MLLEILGLFLMLIDGRRDQHVGERCGDNVRAAAGAQGVSRGGRCAGSGTGVAVAAADAELAAGWRRSPSQAAAW